MKCDIGYTLEELSKEGIMNSEKTRNKADTQYCVGTVPSCKTYGKIDNQVVCTECTALNIL